MKRLTNSASHFQNAISELAESAPALGAGNLSSEYQSPCKTPLPSSLNNQQLTAEDTSGPECPVCGGEVCEHGVCRANWCQHDDFCSECHQQELAEDEATDNAAYYADWGEVFGEEK